MGTDREASSRRVGFKEEFGILHRRVLDVEVQVFHSLVVKAARPALNVSLPAGRGTGERSAAGLSSPCMETEEPLSRGTLATVSPFCQQGFPETLPSPMLTGLDAGYMSPQGDV